MGGAADVPIDGNPQITLFQVEKRATESRTIVQTGGFKELKLTFFTDKKISNPESNEFYKTLIGAKVSFGIDSYPSYECVSNNENNCSYYYQFDTAKNMRYFITGYSYYLEEGAERLFRNEGCFRILIEHNGLYNDKKNKFLYKTTDGKSVMKLKGEIADHCFDLIKNKAKDEGIQVVVERFGKMNVVKQKKLKHKNVYTEKWQRKGRFIFPLLPNITNEAKSIGFTPSMLIEHTEEQI